MERELNCLNENIVVQGSFYDEENNFALEQLFGFCAEEGLTETNELARDNQTWFTDLLGSVFVMSDEDVRELKENGSCTLVKRGNIADFINTTNPLHLDFLLWWYACEEVEEAVKIMYDACGWVITDGSWESLQARKTVVEDEIYLFREHRVTDPLNGTLGMYESEMNIHDYSWQEKVDACEPFGYDAVQVDKWIVEGDENALILECIFEQET